MPGTHPVDKFQQALDIVNVPKGKHAKKEVEGALRYAEENDWTIEQTKSGHR